MTLKKLDKEERKELLSMVSDRFSIPLDEFREFNLYAGEKGKLFLLHKHAANFVQAVHGVVTAGLPFGRVDRAFKPSTNFLQLFGKKATTGFISISREEAIKFAEGQDLTLKEESGDGYVLVNFEGEPIGCGLLRGKELKCTIPKAKRLKLSYL